MSDTISFTYAPLSVMVSCDACVSKPPVCTQNTFVPMSFVIAPATACSASPKPLFGYVTLGL